MNKQVVTTQMSNTGSEYIADEALSEITMLLNLRRSINMSMYKDNYMKRRIAIRMRSTYCENVSNYCHLLRSSEEELDLLVKALTIHVSQFYRNSSLFETLRTQTLPYIFQVASDKKQNSISISCFGCACGEEPYSLAILLKEHFNREIRQIPATITGVDIDPQTISMAIEATYPLDRLRDLPSDLKERYFRVHEEKYKLIPNIKEMINFKIANIIDSSTYTPADLVLCRNTLIYFVRPDQEKILNNITEILPTGGILVLGKSETVVGAARRSLETVSMEERIYRKK